MTWPMVFPRYPISKENMSHGGFNVFVVAAASNWITKENATFLPFFRCGELIQFHSDPAGLVCIHILFPVVFFFLSNFIEIESENAIWNPYRDFDCHQINVIWFLRTPACGDTYGKGAKLGISDERERLCCLVAIFLIDVMSSFCARCSWCC